MNTEAGWAHRPRQLVRELGVCRSRGASPRHRWRLARDTARFHLANYSRRPPQREPVLRYRVRIASRTVDLALRPYAGDFFVLHEVLGGGVYDIPQAWRHRIRTVVDLGAHVGIAALYLLESLPDALITCVEPAADNATLLRENLSPFADRVVVLQGAVAAHSGVRHFDQRGWSWGGRLSEDGAAAPVRCFSLPEIMRRANLATIDLLKVDVEGTEDALFAAAEAWLPSVGSIMIEIHEPYSLDRFRRDMDRAGLRVLDADGPWGNRVTMAVRRDWIAPAAVAAAAAARD